ncbi:hypothetical protein SERLA73DRAFT_121982 [Serpula lacrymans var. lacrymans S7.3]|uniref:Uncharacterized protein n=2 Tax=Serpula lacrymans var. lacrymans TaxID=341189 RepID=F8PW16_SERL3|nr:uncharacterized protein SERLADRAFT_387375 [Serpula lacrymans var. lacrymans S7.9]EGN99875.1 hypothetical protein SERLA73DRAFT_121982 [Serpula lacrymans var. lacrymans S7.3]EGO25443.1 hypothetical protein SERLADRAFT_387375 [Serpula lacrymans var. lacrymans S7.9]
MENSCDIPVTRQHVNGVIVEGIFGLHVGRRFVSWSSTGARAGLRDKRSYQEKHGDRWAGEQMLGL